MFRSYDVPSGTTYMSFSPTLLLVTDEANSWWKYCHSNCQVRKENVYSASSQWSLQTCLNDQ